MKRNIRNTIMFDLDNIEVFILDSLARENIKTFMEDKKISQRKLAEMSMGGISYGFILKLLSGQTDTIRKDKLLIICKILKIDIDNIFANSAKLSQATPS